jgi:hypothetical protein
MRKRGHGPLLFNLIGQCFQGIGLIAWTSVIAKQCPINEDPTKVNFDKCIRDYIEAVARFPNIGMKYALIGEQIGGWCSILKARFKKDSIALAMKYLVKEVII